MLNELTSRPSAKVLILANLLPLFGVLFLDWSVFNIVVLYWMENLVLGVINILKMITCKPDVSKIDVGGFIPGKVSEEQRDEIMGQFESVGGVKAMTTGHTVMKLFMIPFFTVHYFGFCAGHGIFVFAFFGRDAGHGVSGHGLSGAFDQLPQLLTGTFALAAIGLIVSHLFSFFSNYLGRGENRKTIVPLLMFKPYGRIVVLHIAIIFGGFLVVALGIPMGLLLIMVVGKIILDLKMHLLEHAKAAIPATGSPLLSAIISRGSHRHR